MPPSIIDNPESFFEELNKPKEKESPKVEVSPVASPVAPVSEQNTKTPKSVADDPEAFFSGLTGPMEPQKQETPQSLFLGQVAGKKASELDDFDMQSLDLLTPKELEDVSNQRKDIPLTENLLQRKFEHERSLPWNEGMRTAEDWKKIGQEVFGGGVSFLRGAQKFAEQSLFSNAEQDPSGWGHPNFQPVKDYVSGIAALPEDAAYLFTKLKEGGMDLKDRVSESIGVQDRQKSYENYKARHLVDRIQAQEMQENPSIYSRILKGDMANDALSHIILNTLPDNKTIMEQYGLTEEQANIKRHEMSRQIAEQTTSEIAARERPADQDIATFGAFTSPAGLGLGEMGLVSLGVEAGMGLTPKIVQGLKYIGKSDAEIKAMNDAAQALKKDKAMQGLEEAQKPSTLGRVAGALATGVERVEAAGARIGEAIPKSLKELAPVVAGGTIGYGMGGEHRGENVLVGALLGKAGKPLLGAVKYAAKVPSLVRDIEEARVLSAGGSKGTFETLASFPNISEGSAKLLRFGGRRLDNTLNNVVEYAKAGINPTLIALGTGALDSASPEELNQLVSTGLLYGLGGRAVHHAWGKITGVDPVIDARNRRQQDIDDLKTYRDLDPETRKTLDSVTSWDNVVERHTQRAQAADQAYADAVARGAKNAEKLGQIALAEKNVLKAVTRANVQTRDEFSRQFVTQLTNLNQLVNGTLRAGQNNVGIHILTPDQIVAKFRSDPANSTATDAEILDAASQRGFYSTPEGAVEYQYGMGMDAPTKKLVFDRTKPSVVINADALKARMMIEGSNPIDALNHEVGHHVRNIPEFREANKDAESMLFSQEVKDPSGKVVAVTAGQYSPKDLVDMYLNDYLKGKTPDEVTQLSQLAGVWDYSRGALNENAVAEYMKDEIIAELNAETFSTHLGRGLDNGVLHMVDVARLKTKKNLLDRAIQRFAGLGGKGDATSDLTGAKFSPDVLAANRQAMRALQSLQGEVSQAVKAAEAPKISRAEMMRNKALRERFGKYAGLFKTKMQGQVFDGNGNPIGTPIDITNPNAAEGSWETKGGVTTQLNGYGARPDEVAESAGVVIPDGGRLVVQKQIVTQPDGVTPVMMTPKEAKALQKSRADVIRQSLNTPDEGAPNRFEPVSDDSETWRGTFTPLQIQAIKDMPEGIVPKSIKDHILKINDMLVKKDGARMLVDYAAVMNDAGKYTAYSPKFYDVVPIGMHLSKDGNFLVTTISVGRMFDKLNAWSERMPSRLAPWGGSKDAFFKEFTEKYLQNWQYREKDDKGNEMYPKGKAGETGLSGSAEEALAKKDIFNDFLNLTTNDFRATNLDRTKTPRRRGDVRGKDIDRTIMSMRLDHMAELMDNENAPKVPIDYKNAISNFMPSEEPAPAPAQEERRQEPIDLGITAAHSPKSRPFSAQYVAREQPVTENAKSITKQYGEYPKGTKVVVGQRSKDPLDTNILVQFPDGKVEKFPISWLKSDSAQGQSGNLKKLVKDQGRDAVNILLGEWDQNAVLNPDGTGIISAVDPRESMKKTKVPTSDFIEWLKGQDIEAILAEQGGVKFMPYSPELPKTEDGKVDWDGFKTKTMEIAKPLAALAPIGGISFKPAQEIELDKPDAVQKAGVATKLPKKVPESGHYTIAMQPTDDGREVQYQVDPASTITPKVGSIEDIDGEQVGILEADRHTTRGDNMGGPLHPFLISNQVIARLLDGRGFKPVWANMNSAFVTRAKNIITNTTNGRALIQIMKEQAHKSNRKFVQDIMQEIDATKKNLSADEKDALHVILELGAKNPAKHLTRVTKAAKLLKDGEITQSEFEMIKSQNADKIEKYGPQVEFLKKLGTMKSMATKGNRAGFDKAFKDHNDQFKNEDWYKKIVNKYKNTTFQDEASRFTFVERGAAMSRLDGIAFAPPIGKRLAESMDFRGGKNLDLVASVQLSKDPDAFAIYTGKDPKQEAKMSKNERILRDQFMKDPNFRKHPSYDWMMLGPENADNFILEKPVDPMSLFPDYAKNHPKESVRNGSKETIVGTMKKSKIPLIIKTKK